MYTILLYIPYSSKVSSAEPEGWAAVVSINLSSIIDSFPVSPDHKNFVK